MESVREVDAMEYFFTPSTHSCVLAAVPLTVVAAETCTGELTVEPLAGVQIFTPGDVGAVQLPVPATVAFTTLSHFWPAVLVARTAKR